MREVNKRVLGVSTPNEKESNKGRSSALNEEESLMRKIRE